jgi:hypothetical protein
MTTEDEERLAERRAIWEAKHRSLLDAAKFVESIPIEQFNMDHWWLESGMAFDEDRNRIYRVANGPCGCPIGHMVQKGLFGLKKEDLENERQRIFVIIGDAFGIGYKKAEFMFDQYAYTPGPRTREAVAKRIRFIAEELGIV